MRVVHVYKDVYPPICGGVEMTIHHLVEGTRDICGDVRLLVANRRKRTEYTELEGIPVTKALTWGRPFSNPICPSFPYHLARTDADILHVHLPMPTTVMSYLVSRPKGKLIVHYHSDIVRQAAFLPFYKPFLHRFLSRADVIVATSPAYLETSEILKRHQDRCRVIPLGVPMSRFMPTEEVEDQAQVIRRRYGMRLILYVGVLRYYKGVEVLLRAMEHVDGTLLVVGGGPLMHELTRLHDALPWRDRIHFIGEVEDVVPYYYAADLFCLPSILRSEAFGLVLAEAAACGLPLVSTELGTGTSYINVHNKTGLVVPPGEPEALGGALKQLLDSNNQRLEFGAEARRRAHRLFTLEKMTRSVLELYRDVAGLQLPPESTEVVDYGDYDPHSGENLLDDVSEEELHEILGTRNEDL